MATLEGLGVVCDISAQNRQEVIYTISIPPGKLKTPEALKRHYTRLITAISLHAQSNGLLWHLRVSVPDEYREGLHSAAKELAGRAANAWEELEHGAAFPDYFIKGLAIAGGIVGLGFGCHEGLKAVADLAQSLNNVSPLLTPVTGLAQLVFALAGAGVGGVVGALGGKVAGIAISSPYLIPNTLFACKHHAYVNLEQTLARRETL